MKPVDYDLVASAYDRRYETNRFDGIDGWLKEFIRAAASGAVAEVGCGTGHWLQRLADAGCQVLAGLDLSIAMLRHARRNAGGALLVQGVADQLPWADASFDRVFCINALHHFTDHDAFLAECERVLRPAGGFLTIGLDPHQGVDTWWIYDYFPAALRADLARYPAAAATRARLTRAGFRDVSTTVAQHLPAAVPFDSAGIEALLDRRSASQLMVISDDDYATGRARLESDRPVLRADLRLYATTAWK